MRDANRWVGAKWRAPQDDVRGRVLTFRTQAVRVEPTEEKENKDMADKTLPNVNPRPLVPETDQEQEPTERQVDTLVEWFEGGHEPQPYDRMHVSDEIDISEARRRWERLQYGLE